MLFTAGYAWVASTLMTEWAGMFLLDAYLLCCMFGILCLHLESCGRHLNILLLCQEWIPSWWTNTEIAQQLEHSCSVWAQGYLLSVHMLCTLRTGSWHELCCWWRCNLDIQSWNHTRFQQIKLCFFPLCSIMVSNVDLSIEILYDKINIHFEKVHYCIRKGNASKVTN